MSTDKGLLPASRCANRIYRLGMELDALLSDNPDMKYGYASAMARVLREEGFTPGSLIEAIGEGFIRRTRLMGWLEMSDERSHNSPLHNRVGCSYCESGGPNPQPVDSDDPTGAIARIEMLAEMLPSERQEFLSRKKES